MFDDDHVAIGTLPNGQLVPLHHVDRRRHVYVIGKSGTGKSTLLYNLMCADLDRGAPFALLDPHGDLATMVADAVPRDRTGQVIFWDPSDLAHPFGFNPLAGVPPDRRSLVAANILSAIMHAWGGSLADWPRLTYILTNSLLLLLAAPGSTLLGLPKLLADPVYRQGLLAHARDPVVRAFWQAEFAQLSDRDATQAIAPIQNRIGMLLSPLVLRHMLGQVRPTIDVGDIMNSGKTLIVKIAKGQLGETPTFLIGALLVTAIAQAAESRADIPEDDRRDFTLFCDEFQHFATSSFVGTLSEARKYRLGLVLAHQFIGQLPEQLRASVFGNAASMCVFKVGADDAGLLADELAIESKSALTDTPRYAAWMRILQHGETGDTRLVTTLPPDPIDHGRLEAVRARSRARYSRPRVVVEAKLRRFYKAP